MLKDCESGHDTMAFNYDSQSNNNKSGGGGGGKSPGRRDEMGTGTASGIEMVQIINRLSGSNLGGGGAQTHTPKTPRKILNQGGSSANQTPVKKLQFSTPEVHTVPASPTDSPKIMILNRKREEEIVMANLRKKVPACELTPRRRKKNPVQSTTTSTGFVDEGVSGDCANDNRMDNRPSIPKSAVMDSNNNCNNLDDSSVKASGSTASSTILDKDFVLELLCWHNEYRARHAVTALTISTELCEYAQKWANHLAENNEFYYRSDKSIGQNLFCCPISALVTDLTGQEVASFWYSTLKKYNYLKDRHLLHTNVNAGHFAQMIWASSRYLGVGKATSRTGKIFVVAFYFPPGNIVDEYHTNVPPPIVECGQEGGQRVLTDTDSLMKQ